MTDFEVRRSDSVRAGPMFVELKLEAVDVILLTDGEALSIAEGLLNAVRLRAGSA